MIANPVNLLRFSAFNELKPILQTEVAECGLACLAMISSYYGQKYDLNSLRHKFQLSLKGADLNQVINIAEKLNFTSRPLRLEINELSKLATPCILHWKMSHYVVLKSVNRHAAIIVDPASGKQKITFKQMAKYFTGIALELTPTKSFKKYKGEKHLRLSDLWQTITGLKKSLVQIFVLSLLLQIFAMVSPFYMQLVVDDVLITHDQDLLKVLSLGFLLLLFINISVTLLRSLFILILGSQLSFQIANNLFRHLLRLPNDWFEKRHIGDVISRFGSLENVKQLLTTGIIESIVDGIMVVGTVLMMFIYNTKVAWFVLASVFIYGLIRFLFFQPLKQLNEESLVANAKRSSNFIETVKATQAIKIFNKENHRQSIWQNHYARSMNASIKLTKMNIIYSGTNGLIFGIENIVVIYLSALTVVAGEMSVGMLYAFMAYKMQFTGKATSLIEKFIQFKMLDLHLSRIADIALSPIEEGSSRDIEQAITGHLELIDLKFSYSETEPLLLNQASLTINAGESIAITGPSGCGKSTLMKILLGLLTLKSGKILLDGIDVSTLNRKSYRQHIAAVMQDDQLMSGSLADNICFFDQDFDQSFIESCAKLAAIHDDIVAMPMGYNSLIGDMGSSLSGGQKQRLLLARALYKKPKILFLDEATSHLDTVLETTVNLNIGHLKMTRIIIAHRKETIDSADRVVKLIGGKLINC